MGIASAQTTADRTPARIDAGPPRPQTFSVYVSTCRGTLIAIAVAVLAIFLPTVVVPYAFSDDYTALWMADGWGPSAQFGKNILDASAITGRPFSGLLNQAGFAAAGTIENLRYLRLVAVLTIVVLAIVIHWSLVRSRIRPIPAALIAVLICSLPPFQVYASWATLYTTPLAVLLAGAASIFTVAAIDGQRELRRDRLLGATSAMFAALLIYQPAAQFFWVFFAVALVGAVEQSGRSLSLIKAHFGVGIAALALAYLEIKITVHFMGSSTTGAARNTLTHDVTGKAAWFFEQPLYRSLNLFDITPTRPFAVLVGVVAIGGIMLWLVRRGARPLLFAAVGLALIPLTYLPNLVVTENWAAYRTQASIDALIALYACLGTLALLVTVRDRFAPQVSGRALIAGERAAFALSIVFVASSVVIAAKNVTTLFVVPHSTEDRILRSQVAALPDGAPKIAFVQTDWYGGLSKEVVYDEFGFPSSVRQWTFEPAVDLILHEQGRLERTGPRPVVEVWPSYTTTLPNEPVIDLRGLAQLR